jgi:hypothetical protein
VNGYQKADVLRSANRNLSRQYWQFLVAVGIFHLFSVGTRCASAAEPYINAPPELKSCDKPAVIIPDGAKSLFYPSDQCGTIFVGPPATIKTETAATFSSISSSECKAIASLIDQKAKIQQGRIDLSQKIVDGSMSTSDYQQQLARINAALDVLNGGLDDDYKTFGAKTAISISQEWVENVRLYQEKNSQYVVYPLNTVGGIITFEEYMPPAKLEKLGIYDNHDKRPYISYTISGLSLLPTDSPLIDENKLPIFFPIARNDRAELKSIQFGGGGVTASVTFNKAGFCQLSFGTGQNPASFLTPTITFNMALKTFGTYTVEINIDYLMKAMDSVTKETSGTYFASAVADRWYDEQSINTVRVNLDQDLKNSLKPVQQDAFVQQILYDAANQFLVAVTGKAGERVPMPDVANVEKYKTVQTARRVCSRSGGLFGTNLFSSTNCWDQAYNIQVLQDTTQFQKAEQRVKASFKGTHESRTRSYVLVPWNASLAK